jgi:hypothetical protein
MNFLEVLGDLEQRLEHSFECEMLELHYIPYSFGSGMAAYSIAGRVLKVDYEGKTDNIQISLSAGQQNYPAGELKVIFSSSVKDLNYFDLNRFF